jgi:hypothetical protein
VPHAFKGGPKLTAAVRSCQRPTGPVRERRHRLRSLFTNAGAAEAAVPAGRRVGPELSCTAHSVEAELTPRYAVLHRVTGHELSAPATALPLATAGPNSPLTSPLSPAQVTARRAASSPATCASPPHRSLPPSLRAGEAPHHRHLLLTSVRPPHLLPVCCLLSTRVAVAVATPCRHAA